MCQASGERGAALLTCLLSLVLLAAIGSALTLSATTDQHIAANAGAASEALAAAHAAFARAVAELALAPDLTAVLDGSWRSQFVDGAPAGTRPAPGGGTLNLAEVVGLAGCARRAGCSTADLDTVSARRPWGTANPRWALFSHGTLDGTTGMGARGAPLYVVALVADDPADGDGNPLRDATVLGSGSSPGAGVVFVRAEAFGRRDAHRVVEGAVLRLDLQAAAIWEAADPLTRGPRPVGFPEVQVLSLGEVR
ncbi:MAG: hypothetical protein U0Q55_08670 [Vicinamibacterales bacterium]